jgi:putative membrane protein, TIGR04086 family
MKGDGKLIQLGKGVLFSLIFTLLAILVFAAVVKVFELSDRTILMVNQVLKIIAILLGCMIGLKGEGCFWKGIIVGFVTALIGYVTFSLLSGEPLLRMSLLYESLFGVIVGGISGLICRTIKQA